MDRSSRLEQWWVPAPALSRVDRLDVRPGGGFVTRPSDDGIHFTDGWGSVTAQFAELAGNEATR